MISLNQTVKNDVMNMDDRIKEFPLKNEDEVMHFCQKVFDFHKEDFFTRMNLPQYKELSLELSLENEKEILFFPDDNDLKIKISKKNMEKVMFPYDSLETRLKLESETMDFLTFLIPLSYEPNLLFNFMNHKNENIRKKRTNDIYKIEYSFAKAISLIYLINAYQRQANSKEEVLDSSPENVFISKVARDIYYEKIRSSKEKILTSKLIYLNNKSSFNNDSIRDLFWDELRQYHPMLKRLGDWN